MSGPVQPSGLFASTRRLLATVIEIGQVRLELAGTEVEFEKRRILDALVWASVGLLLMGVGIVLLCGFVILLFWEGYRLAAVGVMTLLCLGGAALVIWHARERLRSPNGMFAATLAELKQDLAGLRASDQHAQQ
jgi:uncharacterized membrane protein YqjE